MGWMIALVTLIIFALILSGLLLYFKNKIGGITGDTLGATTEVIETLFLVIGWNERFNTFIGNWVILCLEKLF